MVETDKSLKFGDLDSYKTFTFAKHIDDAADNTFFWESELIKTILRDEIIDEMQALGYEHVMKDADIMVNFRIFEEDVEFQGWEETYVNKYYWGDLDLTNVSVKPGEKKILYLKKGTLLIQFVDMKESNVVWQGYASGVLNNARILDDEKIRLDTAVEKIFDEYDYKAAG